VRVAPTKINKSLVGDGARLLFGQERCYCRCRYQRCVATKEWKRSQSNSLKHRCERVLLFMTSSIEVPVVTCTAAHVNRQSGTVAKCL